MVQVADAVVGSAEREGPVVTLRAHYDDGREIVSAHTGLAPPAPGTRVAVEISRDAQAHYHKRLTEIYYFLEGEGHLELDGVLHPVRPGMTILIRPGTRHRAVVRSGAMTILNVVVPPFDPRDEWLDP